MPFPVAGRSIPHLDYLPAADDSSRRRYPVVYFLHGLPANPQSDTQNACVAHALVTAHEQRIVVTPLDARANDSDPDPDYLAWSASENWPRAISHDLTARIDHRFQTIATCNGRALIGLSDGGYGAFKVGPRALQTFAAVESWSGYFVGTDLSRYNILKLRSTAAQRVATALEGSPPANEVARWPSRIAYHIASSDDRSAEANQALDPSLRRSGIGHVFRVYPGGHSGLLWQAQAPSSPALALTYLATGRTVPRPS